MITKILSKFLTVFQCTFTQKRMERRRRGRLVKLSVPFLKIQLQTNFLVVEQFKLGEFRVQTSVTFKKAKYYFALKNKTQILSPIRQKEFIFIGFKE